MFITSKILRQAGRQAGRHVLAKPNQLLLDIFCDAFIITIIQMKDLDNTIFSNCTSQKLGDSCNVVEIAHGPRIKDVFTKV